MYTFLAIAPCNFTVNGKHYSAEAGTPIQVEYNEALIMSSPTFRYRNYLRVITPIEPPKVEPESSKTTEQVITSTQPLDSTETIKPIETPEEKIESVEPKPSRKSRSKKEEITTELKEEIQINTEVMNLF